MTASMSEVYNEDGTVTRVLVDDDGAVTEWTATQDEHGAVVNTPDGDAVLDAIEAG
jgi:hypothetical protein